MIIVHAIGELCTQVIGETALKSLCQQVSPSSDAVEGLESILTQYISSLQIQIALRFAIGDKNHAVGVNHQHPHLGFQDKAFEVVLGAPGVIERASGYI